MAATLQTQSILPPEREVEQRFPLGKIRLLHKAIRQKVALIVASVQNLGPLSPDAHFLHIGRSIEVLEDIVLSHCKAEDDALFPAVSEKTKRAKEGWTAPHANPIGTDTDLGLSGTSGAPGSRRHGTHPAKRQRTSPANDNMENCAQEHGVITESLNSLRNILKEACDRHEPDAGATPSSVHRSGGNVCSSSSMAQESWQIPIRRIKKEANSLAKVISEHLEVEERDLFPLWRRIFSPGEQGSLLVKTILLSVGTNWPRSFGYLCTADLTSLFEDVAFYASDEDLSMICERAAPFISDDVWKAVCSSVPKLYKFERPSGNALAEIVHIRRALRNEIQDLIPHCQNLNISCKSQLQSFSSRFAFAEQMFSFLAEGEDKLILLELRAALANSQGPSESFSIERYRQVRTEIGDRVADLNRLIISLTDSLPSPQDAFIETSPLADGFSETSALMISHLEDAETHLHPLIAKHFGSIDQESIAGRIMSQMPEDVLHDLVVWMFNLVSINELEAMLRCLGRRISAIEFERTAMKLVNSAQKGTILVRDWAELCSRLPELHRFSKVTHRLLTSERHGPVSEILRVHKAIRVDMNVLLLRTKGLPVDGGVPNPRTLGSIATRVAFLRRMVHDHAKAEDDILLPRLEARKPGSTKFCSGEHDNERVLFGELAKCLRDLQCVTDANDSSKLVWRLRVAARTLRDEMVSHLAKEEEELWPLVTTLFDRNEQSEIVALIFGNMPSDRLRELLPWMIRVLSVAERNEMMEHILEVTRSTMFEKWLKTWLPLDDKDDGGVMHNLQEDSSSLEVPRASENSCESQSATAIVPTSNADCAQQVLKHGCDSIKEMVKEIARNEAIDMETRTRLMQDVMLAPFTERQEEREVARNQSRKQEDNMEPTYKRLSNGKVVLGCTHYQRGVKLRASCCGRLYTCRLCHDDAEETHVMDRYATTEILCMHCSTLQPVSGKCISESCQKSFAVYFCSVCKLYDDDSSRSLYHCHSCNVCRLGKGLGVDVFHCMKCNQCMNMKFRKGHVCVENAMESGCPVCYEYLFTSTAPVKYLHCGHVLHDACFKEYSKKRFSCPVCSKSLQEMAPVYKRIDRMLSKQRLPPAYRNMLCDIFCNDCNKRSKSPFHFLYQKCQLCKSYNTRIN